MGLSYYQPEQENNVTYSIDKLVIKGEFLSSGDSTQKFLNELSNCLKLDFYHYTSTKRGSYREVFNFSQNSLSCNPDTYWLGVDYNHQNGRILPLWKLEVNPNKIMPSVGFEWLLNALMKYSLEWKLDTWDLAIDYPILRENAHLIKDNRYYQDSRYSWANRTEYLGKRHTEGYCKLSHPLTRLEITLGGVCSVADIHKLLPTVFVMNDLQMTFDEMKLNETERIVWGAVVAEPSLITGLGRYMRKKIECALEQHTLQLGISNKPLTHIIQQKNAWSQLLIPDSHKTEVNAPA